MGPLWHPMNAALRAVVKAAVHRHDIRVTGFLAASHRVMVVEVMGRYAGWIALEAGLAGGGEVVLIPEIQFRYEAIRRCARQAPAGDSQGGGSLPRVASGRSSATRCPPRTRVSVSSSIYG